MNTQFAQNRNVIYAFFYLFMKGEGLSSYKIIFITKTKLISVNHMNGKPDTA